MENIINDSSKTDEERTVAKDKLIAAVMSQSLGINGNDKKFDESVDGYYTVLSTGQDGSEVTQYYKASITDQGTIEVWEYTLAGTEYVDSGSGVTYTNQEDYQQAIDGKIDGKDYRLEHKDAIAATEAEYSVTYTAHEADEESESYKSKYEKENWYGSDKVDELTKDTKTNTELQGMYIIATSNGVTYRYEWDSSKQEWMQVSWKSIVGWTKLLSNPAALTNWKQKDIKGIYYKTDVIETANNVKDSELSKYKSMGYIIVTITLSKEATAAIPEEWRVIDLQQVNSYELTDEDIDGQQSSLYKEYNDKKQAKDEAEATLSDAQTKVKNLTTDYNTKKAEENLAQQEYNTANKNYSDAKSAYDKADAEYEAKKQAYDKYYGTRFTIFPSEYEKDLAKAKAELVQAKLAREAAKKVLEAAQKNQAEAKQAHSEAVDALETASKQLASTMVDALKAFVELSDKRAEVRAAKAKLELAEGKEAYANSLEQKCAKALAAAQAAQAAIDKYDVSIDGKDKLDALEKELEDAKAKYEELQKKAEEARQAANQAALDAQAAVDRVAALIAEEAARRNEAASTTTTTTTTSSNTTVYYATPSIDTEVLARTILEIDDEATPLAGDATTAATVRSRTVAAAEGDTTTIGDEETPLAGDIVSDSTDSDAVTFIEDEETPLAGGQKDSFNWWWLLLVAIAGAAGGTYYYNKKKKSQTIETK